MTGIERLFRVGALLLALASAETLHGVFRATVLVPRIGKRAALRVSLVTGSLLALAVCRLMVPATGISSASGLLGLGFVLAVFMASFDVALARWLLKRPWAKVAAEFDPRSGNLLLFGLIFLLFCPYLSVSW